MKFYPLFAAVFFVLVSTTTWGQNADGNYMVAFYNVENLFDTLDDKTIKDEEFTPAGENQWTNERYQNKLANLAKVISTMNNGNGPDVLGLCEIENSRVVKDLINTPALKKMNYGIVMQDMRDARGIDVALIYKEDVLPWISFTTLHVDLPDSVPVTRDVLMVQTELEEKGITFMVCHFPSRSEGREKSEYKRIAAANVVRHAVDSLLAANKSENILIMGDFNDEPADSSISKVIGATDPAVKEKPKPMFNLMYPLKNKGLGSYKYREEWNMLDQIIVNADLYVGNNGLQYVKESATIMAEDWMKQTEPKYFGSPMRTFGGKKYLGGYSDHFPVYIYLSVKK